jgi:hypothetical protein
MMMSIEAERGWSFGSLDIKAAYLQAEDFIREIYVTPPQEEAEYYIVWRLTAAAYGLADSGILWFLTSSRALKTFGLTSSCLDSSTWVMNYNTQVCLIVLVQVDNYIYAGVEEDMRSFEKFTDLRFKVGSIERDTFAVYGIEISRSTEGSYRVDQNVKKNTLDLYPYVLIKDRQGREPATDREVRFIMSTVGSLLFIRRVTRPPLIYIASHFGSRISRLQVRHVKELNALLKKAHKVDFVLAFEKPPAGVEVTILGYSDASYYRKT